MKKYLILFVLTILLIPGMLFSDIFTFRVGYFIPRADSDLWEIEFENMDFTKTDFQASSFCFSYEYFFTSYSSIIIGVESYKKQKMGYYTDYIGYTFYGGSYAYPNEYEGLYDEKFIPSHVFSVSSTPIMLSLKILPMGRAQKVIPYIGAGGALYLWSVQLEGDMVDFSEEYYDTVDGQIIEPVYRVYYTETWDRGRFTFGAHVFGGVMVPIANRISLEGEFKYNIVEGRFKEDSHGFQGFEPIDLGGYQISIGLNYWF